MYDYYELISEVKTSNELLKEQNANLLKINESVSNLNYSILCVGIILVAYILHHIFDAVWKR